MRRLILIFSAFFILTQLSGLRLAFAAGVMGNEKPIELTVKSDGKKEVQHSCCHAGAKTQMLFNPAFGDDIYHTHTAGEWMFSYKFMHMKMKGLRDGTTNIPLSDVIPMAGTKYGYMMAPTEMTMDMHMFMGMYGINDSFTVMGMVNCLNNAMVMFMNMGMKNRQEPLMRTSGLGDIELRGNYKIDEGFVGSLGLSLPTGDIDKEFTTMGMRFRDPYDMQLGSGSYDLKPALTYNGFSVDTKWNWGAQTQYVYHVNKNENHYKLGDTFKATGWLQRSLGHLTPSLRLAYNSTEKIKGQDPEIQKLLDPVMGAPTPDADPANYGGQRLDGLVGLGWAMGSFSLGVEGGMPLYQKLNGLQMRTKWVLSASAQVMF